MALATIPLHWGGGVQRSGWVQPWATRSRPGSAADVERARARFREEVAWRLAAAGLPWPDVTADRWDATHYALPPVAPRVTWWRRWLYGPLGRKRA